MQSWSGGGMKIVYKKNFPQLLTVNLSAMLPRSHSAQQNRRTMCKIVFVQNTNREQVIRSFFSLSSIRSLKCLLKRSFHAARTLKNSIRSPPQTSHDRRTSVVSLRLTWNLFSCLIWFADRSIPAKFFSITQITSALVTIRRSHLLSRFWSKSNTKRCQSSRESSSKQANLENFPKNFHNWSCHVSS